MSNSRKGAGLVTINNLSKGETLLYRIRMVHEDIKDPSKGFRPSIELAEFIENPFNPRSAIADLNEDDERFDKAKPRFTFQPTSFEIVVGEGWATKEACDKLIHAKGVKMEDQKEGVHFITVNYLNPERYGKRLRVQVIETTETSRRGAQPKINPKTGALVLSGGKQVFMIPQVAYEGNHKSVFLQSDKGLGPLQGVSIAELLAESDEKKASENMNP